MYLKTENGHANVATKGEADTALGIGIAGLATSLLGGPSGLLGGGLLGNNGGGNVSRYELDLVSKNTALSNENALLKADKYTDEKIVEATKYLMGEIGEVRHEFARFRDHQTEVNAAQMAWNATNTATLQCMQGQIAQLMGLTKLVVPNGSVCPGWGNVNVTPAATTGG
jgi:hypothetical protein